jgi:DNA-binding response OmpR family regulator
MQGDKERALDAGFDDYITKPMTFSKLKAQLELPRGAAAGDD